MTPGEKLRALREGLGLSVREAAKASGISFRGWYRYEAGDSYPSKAHRIAINAALVYKVAPFQM
jgi:transcriptional regulator with XRE-family HTH domain